LHAPWWEMHLSPSSPTLPLPLLQENVVAGQMSRVCLWCLGWGGGNLGITLGQVCEKGKWLVG
jgi:hypothetical protein